MSEDITITRATKEQMELQRLVNLLEDMANEMQLEDEWKALNVIHGAMLLNKLPEMLNLLHEFHEKNVAIAHSLMAGGEVPGYSVLRKPKEE